MFKSQPRDGLLSLRRFLDFLLSIPRQIPKSHLKLCKIHFHIFQTHYSLPLCYLRVYFLNHWSTEITKYFVITLYGLAVTSAVNWVNSCNIWLITEPAIFTVSLSLQRSIIILSLYLPIFLTTPLYLSFQLHIQPITIHVYINFWIEPTPFNYTNLPLAQIT